MNGTKLIKKHIAELKTNCNRYTNGQCTTLACLKRGNKGRRPEPPIDYDIATCETWELIDELEQLVNYVKESLNI